MFALVAVENAVLSFDKKFTYSVPSEMKVLPGQRVTVPFGGGNKTRIAMVMNVANSTDAPLDKIKAIISVLDKEAILSQDMLSLAEWMKNRYYCSYYDAIKTMLPTGIGYKLQYVYTLSLDIDDSLVEELSGVSWQIYSLIKKSKKPITGILIETTLGVSEDSPYLTTLIRKGIVVRKDTAKRNSNDAVQKMIRCNMNFDGTLSPKQQGVYDTLVDISETSVKDLSYFTGASNAVIKALADKGAAEIFEEEYYRKIPSISLEDEEKMKNLTLSLEQEKIFDSLVDEFENTDGNISLLYGVTGSGKTSVFLKLIEYVTGKGKEVILMVPEISLTPQTIATFKAKFGDDIAVFHSGLSIGERLDEWKRVSRGEAKIVIGTRSAVFAPCKNLGLIVLDEEQEHTYKSENSPRYHAKDIAKLRVKLSKGLCLLSSATPSLESYYLAKKGVYGLNILTNRFGESVLPEVRLIDMNREAMFGNETDISFALKKGLNDNFRDGKQSIVLLNRRGYHTYVSCSACHEVVSCPHCSISLTYHSANNRLMCHYCGYSRDFTEACPSCGSDTVSYRGYGTQRAEEALSLAVPGAKVLRVDTDTVSAKNSLEKKLLAFSNGEYDILVGTQMVAKGLNFENVTLVGVISADQSLYSDDFRSNERTFDLLTQVVGRAGRGKYPGKAIIQTLVPENPYLRLSANQDYETFYEMEIVYRQAMLYPPFVDIIVVGVVGENENLVKKGAEYYLKTLSGLAKSDCPKLPMRILRPSPASISKIGGKYRYKLIIKSKNTNDLRNIVTKTLLDFMAQKQFKAVTAYADPNPFTIM